MCTASDIAAIVGVRAKCAQSSSQGLPRYLPLVKFWPPLIDVCHAIRPASHCARRRMGVACDCRARARPANAKIGQGRHVHHDRRRERDRQSYRLAIRVRQMASRDPQRVYLGCCVGRYVMITRRHLQRCRASRKNSEAHAAHRYSCERLVLDACALSSFLFHTLIQPAQAGSRSWALLALAGFKSGITSRPNAGSSSVKFRKAQRIMSTPMAS